jgi:Icc-related predicted phosphoesterase
MKRFLVCGGVHGSETALTWLRQTLIERRPNGLLFTGGILSPNRCYAPSITEWGLTRDDARFMEHFFETLGECDVFTAVLPGPYDTPLEDFLRMGMHAEQEYPNLHLAHASLIEEDGVAVCGVGGCLVEEDCQEADTTSRIRANYHLRTLDVADHFRKLLLLPAPPCSLGGEKEGRLIDSLIDGHSADLCAVAGPTEHRGIQRIARTLIVNPGCLADGSAAWVDWRRHPGGHVEFLDDPTVRPQVRVCVMDVDY